MTRFEKEKLNCERLKLLSKKYTKGLSTKEKARLEELQIIIAKAYPRITKKMLKAIKKMLDKIEKEHTENAKRHREYVDKILEECKKDDKTGKIEVMNLHIDWEKKLD